MRYCCFIIVFIWAAVTNAQSFEDPRYCGFVPRAEDGSIKRSSAVVRKFRAFYPCPATGLTDGPCEGWSVDHTVPLSVGGCDALWNLQWLPNSIKSCSRPDCKDRWERKIYRVPDGMIGYNPKCCTYSLIVLGE